ncbi:MAG: hypothetical protein LBD97_06055 [Bifidobacteriaceae bacterium]|jgi:hypothetical protein|nr:hypothetical protein [Bifidobacteriaceae bacterium]
MSYDDSQVRHANSAAPPPRTWPWAIALALVLSGAAVAAYAYLDLDPEEPQVLPTVTVTVTLPPPTPKISASPKDPGTDLFNAIPSVVGAYAYVGVAPNPTFEDANAYDSFTLTYSDGDNEITLLAGQWRTEAAATDAFNQMNGPAGWPGANPDMNATVCPTRPEGEPDTAAMWRNLTAIFAVEAPNGGAAEFYCRMPM